MQVLCCCLCVRGGKTFFFFLTCHVEEGVREIDFIQLFFFLNFVVVLVMCYVCVFNHKKKKS